VTLTSAISTINTFWYTKSLNPICRVRLGATLDFAMTDKTLPEQIADSLRRDILRGILVPGDTVKERDRAGEQGVSRTPMREAIRILALEGLIELRPARSPVVARLDAKSVADDVEVLLAIERLSSQLACTRATSADLEKVAKLNQRMNDGFETEDPLDIFELDMAFHSAIVQAAHNAQLTGIHRTFLARLWRLRFLASIKRRNKERVIGHHNDILEALCARDPSAAEAAIDRHLNVLAKDISDVLEAENDDQAGKVAVAAPGLVDQ